ncbi:NSL complex subunit 1 [Triplophysa tibetana]|uniref:NSL complex subunit 1 n=1 Tax=Triplophysa tibetana TaxID=1572043 RepID=A0A5A9NMX3_9TELE|nr:NSL complex subunit 1 [Triplophysa tibetana]
MYYYCNRNKMSASAAGPGVESCGAGCPHSASRCCGGGGCGEPVSGDGSSAAAATATSAAPAQSSDRESGVAEAQAFREWDDATSIDADRTQKMNEEGFFANGTADITREADECTDSVKNGRGSFCRQSGGAGEDYTINIDHEDAGGLRHGGERRVFMGAMTRRDERRTSARLPPVRTGRTQRGQEHTETEGAMMTAAARCGHGNSEPSVIKRRGCSFTRGSKRVCFSGISSLTYCGISDAEARVSSNGEAHVSGSAGTTDAFESGRQVDTAENRLGSLRRIQCENKTQKINYPACLPDAEGAHSMENTELPTCRTAKGRVRLYRVRSFLASTATNNNGVSGNGAPSACINALQQPPLCLQLPVPDNDQTQQQEAHSGCVKTPLCAFAISSSHSESTQIEGGPPNGTKTEESPLEQNNSTNCDCTGLEVPSGIEGPNTEQIQTVKDEAKRRQAELEGRTDNLWRRLQAVQVKQVERHVTQQLRGLSKSPGLNCTRRPKALSHNSAELSRLARSCSEILRTAESALDSDHTASSSGGDSDSEEDEALERGGRRLRPLSTKSIVSGKEWQWVESRAWLGSRWVWLQTQVSELEYRIRALTELYTHLRQGKVRSAFSLPETPLRASNSSTASKSWRKWHTEDSSTNPQTVPSPPSSAARVRPLLRQRNHRLIRLEDCTPLKSKLCVCFVPVHLLMPPPTEKRERGCVRPGSTSPFIVFSLRHQIHPLRCIVGNTRWSGIILIIQCSGQTRQLHHLGWEGGARDELVESQRGVIGPNCLPQRAINLPILPPTPPAIDTPAQPLRRRRTESSFDLDNLVMPQGLAGLVARVQRLQYKEIITPSWRELDSLLGISENQDGPQPQSSSHYNNTYHQPNGENLENEEEVEDLSDALFLSRHTLCESRERSRWGSWARRRRRGRSSSSYHGDGKSSRGLEQTPGSPDSRQSHFTEGDVSPCSPFCTGAEDPFSLTEDEQQAVLPWEHRLFPLQESELQWLEVDEAEPDEDPCTASGRSQSTDSGISVGSLELSPRTPQPSQQHSGTEQTTPHSLSYKPVTPSTVSTAQDSHTPSLSSYPS